MGILIDITGKKFGRLLVISRTVDPRENPSKHRDSWWFCLCDCGVYCTVRGESIRKGDTRSCGCLAAEIVRRTGRKRIAHKSGAFWILYRRYKSHAAEDNREFTLTEKEFREFTSSICHYCGSPPRKKITGKWSSSIYEYNGIDRKDNSIGYIRDNCVSCCYICNKAKHTSSYEEYLQWIGDLVDYRIKCMKSE